MSETSTIANVVMRVTLVCRFQRLGGWWRRVQRKMLRMTGKPSVPQNAESMIGMPTAQLFTYSPAPSGVKPALLYAMTAKNNDSHSVCPTDPLFTWSSPGNRAMNVMISMTNVVVSTTVSTPLISLSLLVPSSEAVSRRCMALRW